eukprot:2889205-Amphidinium_carterae.1
MLGNSIKAIASESFPDTVSSDDEGIINAGAASLPSPCIGRSCQTFTHTGQHGGKLAASVAASLPERCPEKRGYVQHVVS